MFNEIPISYKVTANTYTAMKWLRKLPKVIACDFEAAVDITKEQLKEAEDKLKELKIVEKPTEIELGLIDYLELVTKISALDHPSRTILTHLSIAWSDRDAIVIVFQDNQIRQTVLNWLVEEDNTQIWHNIGFDGKHIMFHTGKLPKNIEDTQLLAWSLLNHVETFKAKSGLKELMGHHYGNWAVSKDFFTIENMKNKELLKYAAIDACATYKLFEDIQKDLKGIE